MNEHQEHDAMHRAQKAKELKDNPVYQQGYTMIRASIVEALSKVKSSDTETQRDLVMTLQNLDRLERQFDRFIETGNMIEKKRANLNIFRK